MKKKTLLGVILFLILGLSTFYIYLFEYPVNASSTDFKVSRVEVVEDKVNVDVTATQSNIVFKKFHFDTVHDELQMKIVKVKKESFRHNGIHGSFELFGYDGHMNAINRIVIKYEDEDLVIWERE